MIAYILSHNNVQFVIQLYQCVIIYFQTLLTINLQNNRMEDVVAKRFAKVLERNTVKQKYQCDLSFQYSIQTLINLGIGWNDITDIGARSLAKALRRNRVSFICCLLSILLDMIILQTLKCLNLQNALIDIKGIQSFVNVLGENQVKSIS